MCFVLLLLVSICTMDEPKAEHHDTLLPNTKTSTHSFECSNCQRKCDYCVYALLNGTITCTRLFKLYCLLIFVLYELHTRARIYISISPSLWQSIWLTHSVLCCYMLHRYPLDASYRLISHYYRSECSTSYALWIIVVLKQFFLLFCKLCEFADFWTQIAIDYLSWFLSHFCLYCRLSSRVREHHGCR